MKLKKRKKHSRMRGHRTHGFSAKLHKGKGSKGGKGMSGSGKRGDQKKTLVLNKYHPYFGKKGETSRKTERKKIKVINLEDIEKRFNKEEIDLSKYKILGEGEVTKKLIIKAKSISKSAREKIEKAGGKIILPILPEKKEIKKVEKKVEKQEEKKTESKEEKPEEKKGKPEKKKEIKEKKEIIKK